MTQTPPPMPFSCVPFHWLSRTRPGEPGRSADFPGGFLDRLVDVLRAHVEFLGDVLFGLQLRLVHRLLEFALPYDDEGGLPGVDDLPELLDVRAGHATPQMAAHPAHRRAHQRGPDDRRREQDADHGTDGGAAPGP